MFIYCGYLKIFGNILMLRWKVLIMFHSLVGNAKPDALSNFIEFVLVHESGLHAYTRPSIVVWASTTLWVYGDLLISNISAESLNL